MGDNSITCKICGCLNFSSDATCDSCRQPRPRPPVAHPLFSAPRVAPPPPPPSAPPSSQTQSHLRPHQRQFQPSQRARPARGPSNGKAHTNTHGHAHGHAHGQGQRISGWKKPTGNRGSWGASASTNGPSSAASNGGHANGAAAAAVGQATQPRPVFNPRSQTSTPPSLAVAGSTSGAAPAPHSLEALSKTLAGAKTPAASPAATASAGIKRPRVEGQMAKTQVVIDLISSDEEEDDDDEGEEEEGEKEDGDETEDTRLSKKTKNQKKHRQKKKKKVTDTEDKDDDDAVADGKKRPRMGRSFPHIEFRASDFPNSLTSSLQKIKNESSSDPPMLATPTSTGSTPPTTVEAAKVASTQSVRVTTGGGSASTAASLAPSVVKAIATPTATVLPPAMSTSTASIPTSTVPTPPPAESAKVVTAAVPSTSAAVPSVLPSASTSTQSSIPSQPIVVVDSDSDEEGDALEDGEEKEETADRTMPFQSRRFPSITFQNHDFSTMRDGLNVARRTSDSAAVAVHEAIRARNGTTTTNSSGDGIRSSSSTTAGAASTVKSEGDDEKPQMTPGLSTASTVTPPERMQSVTQATKSAPATGAASTATSSSERAQQSKQQPPVAAPPSSAATSASSTQATNVLQPRKKAPRGLTRKDPMLHIDAGKAQNPTATVARPPTDPMTTPPAEAAMPTPAPSPVAIPILRPRLGGCSSDFLQFMRDCVDADDGDEDEEMDGPDDDEVANLLEVVDLTHLTDDSEDEEDEEEEEDHADESNARAIVHSNGYAPSPVPDPSSSLSHGRASVSFSSSSNVSSRVAYKHEDAAASITPKKTGVHAGPTIIKMGASTTTTSASVPTRTRTVTPRPMAPCVLCDKKCCISWLVHCPDCQKYYHRRCAKEYGDDKLCWNCELNGMIDDSELTADHRDEVLGMLSALRQSPDSDGELGGHEDVVADDAVAGQEGEDHATTTDKSGGVPSSLMRRETRSSRRWQAFLDVSTARVDATFKETTQRISSELQDDLQRIKYSKGFSTKESFEAAMAEVLDSYADLQDQLDREAREQKARAAAAAAAAAAEQQLITEMSTSES